jgi:thiol-disulfide isomerase/thioredoxin
MRQNQLTTAAWVLKTFVFASLLALPAGASKEVPKAELSLKSLDGQRVRLSQYRGKIVLLNFWATWCGPCNAEMPMLAEAEKDYSSRGVTFIAASLDDAKGRKQIPAFVSKHHVSFPVWLGATGDDLDRLGMGLAVPATAFLDQEGHIVFRVQGQIRDEELKERLEWLLGSRTGQAPPAVVRQLDPEQTRPRP